MYKTLALISIFLLSFSCSPKLSKIERQQANADSLLTKSQPEQQRILKEKKYHITTAKISLIVFAVWFVAFQNAEDKD